MKLRKPRSLVQPTLVIADDQPDNLLILEDLLGAHYTVHAFGSGQAVLDHIAGGGGADLVLLDVMMPGLDGFEVCRRLKASPATFHIPVIFLTSLDNTTDEAYGLSLGAEDFIPKPPSAPVVLARVSTHLRLSQTTELLRQHNEDLEVLVADRTRELRRQTEELLRHKQQVIAAQDATITAFCALAEARDTETGNHIRRTQLYVGVLAEELRSHPRFQDAIDDETLHLLFKSAPLHDIGKVAIPDAILLKPGRLTPQEWDVMRRHCEYGRDAIAVAAGEFTDASGSFLRFAMDIAYSHHERWDGTGYPEGLEGDAIPVAARVMALADTYDALISKRTYKEPIPHDEAIAIMAAERARQFDPDMVDALLRIGERFRDIAERYGDLALGG